MRAQRIVLFIFLLLLSVVFYGCQKDSSSSSVDVESLMKNVKTYEVDATITFLKDTQPNVIKMRQKAELGGAYTMLIESPQHLKGYQVSYENDEVIEYNPITKTSFKGKVLAARNEVLLGSFIAHYLEDSTATKEETTLDGKKAICFETMIPGDYKYMTSEKLWFDEVTKAPVRMEITGVDGSASILIEFESFKYN